jgi:hypothetical protein
MGEIKTVADCLRITDKEGADQTHGMQSNIGGDDQRKMMSKIYIPL